VLDKMISGLAGGVKVEALGEGVTDGVVAGGVVVAGVVWAGVVTAGVVAAGVVVDAVSAQPASILKDNKINRKREINLTLLLNINERTS
jgi:hypothetical protein